MIINIVWGVDVIKKRVVVLSGLILLFVLGQNSVQSASPELCSQYANTAISQFQNAHNQGMPNLNFPVWSDNYQHHYQWCLTVPDSEVQMGSDFRDLQIVRFLSEHDPAAGNPSNNNPAPPPPPTGSPPTPPQPKTAVIGKVLPIQIPDTTAPTTEGLLNIVKISRESCQDYATKALAMTNQYVKNKCDIKGYQWNKTYKGHEDWCLKNITKIDFALKDQQKGNDHCEEPYAMIVPGMILGMRDFESSQRQDPFVPDKEYYKNKGVTIYDGMGLDDGYRLEKGTGYEYYVGSVWYFARVGNFPFARKPQDYKLPQGVVIGLDQRGKYRTTPTPDWYKVFGVKAAYGPEYLPGGTFHKFCAADIGAGKDMGLCWYESTGLGFNDWPQVNLLPRGTMIGLKHSSSQRDKKIVWQGVTMDPANSQDTPPPGFVRKQAEDRGASTGVGYYWYEKITGD